MYVKSILYEKKCIAINCSLCLVTVCLFSQLLLRPKRKILLFPEMQVTFFKYEETKRSLSTANLALNVLKQMYWNLGSCDSEWAKESTTILVVFNTLNALNVSNALKVFGSCNLVINFSTMTKNVLFRESFFIHLENGSRPEGLITKSLPKMLLQFITS